MTVRGLGWSGFACVVLLVLAVPARAGSLNQKVVDFCKKNLGKQVGDGDCFTFAAAALKAAEAKLGFKHDPGPGDAVWGARVYTLEVKDGVQVENAAKGQRVQPGDVMQFRNTTFAGKNYTLNATQHTAIVVAVGAGGKELTVLHQNWNGKQTVQQTQFLLKDLKSGWVRIYRPLAP
jgi:hypothetical protein